MTWRRLLKPAGQSKTGRPVAKQILPANERPKRGFFIIIPLAGRKLNHEEDKYYA